MRRLLSAAMRRNARPLLNASSSLALPVSKPAKRAAKRLALIAFELCCVVGIDYRNNQPQNPGLVKYGFGPY